MLFVTVSPVYLRVIPNGRVKSSPPCHSLCPHLATPWVVSTSALTHARCRPRIHASLFVVCLGLFLDSQAAVDKLHSAHVLVSRSTLHMQVLEPSKLVGSLLFDMFMGSFMLLLFIQLNVCCDACSCRYMSYNQIK